MRAPIDPKLFRHQPFNGNPPHAQIRYGWVVHLGGPATLTERTWLKAHGYAYFGGGWCRLDRKVVKPMSDNRTSSNLPLREDTPRITIVHGGQTGVDRGAHEAAIDNGWGLAGYMPRDQRDERGRIPSEVARFLVPHDRLSYGARTEANVSTCVAALIVVKDASDPRVTPGTAKTIDLVAARQLLWRVIDPTSDPVLVARWIWHYLLAVGTRLLPFAQAESPAISPRLLVAGPRESKWQGAQNAAAELLREVARALAEISHVRTSSHETVAQATSHARLS
jgi:hypothetical protein